MINQPFVPPFRERHAQKGWAAREGEECETRELTGGRRGGWKASASWLREFHPSHFFSPASLLEWIMQKISPRSVCPNLPRPDSPPEPTPEGATFRIPQSLRVSTLVFCVSSSSPSTHPFLHPQSFARRETRGFFTDHFISYARTLCILKCTRETPSELWPFACSGTQRAFSSWITLSHRFLFRITYKNSMSDGIDARFEIYNWIKSDLKNNHG